MRESAKIKSIVFELPNEAILIDSNVPLYADGWAAHSVVMGTIDTLGNGIGVTRLSIASYKGTEINSLDVTLQVGEFMWSDPSTGQAPMKLRELMDTGFYPSLPDVFVNWGDGYGWYVPNPYEDTAHHYDTPGEYQISIDFPGAVHPYANGYMPLQTGWSRVITVA